METLEQYPAIAELARTLSEDQKQALSSLIRIGQGEIIEPMLRQNPEKIESFLSYIVFVDRFYASIGGIEGYHRKILKLLEEQEKGQQDKVVSIHTPEGVHLEEDSKEVRALVLEGIRAIPHIGELYPIGGAGDRLGLKDSKTGEALPAACLNFLGRTLLEGLVRDVQAKEYVYTKLYGEQPRVPIAMMTSSEKQNDEHIQEICESKNWFGRSPELFFRFKQPLVPVVTKEGYWSFKEPLVLKLKPGGHGVIWKLAEESGAFDWLEKHKAQKLLVRQINNPVAGTDDGIYGFTGIGYAERKAFGFYSCPRKLNAAEGMLVVLEENNKYTLSNIEYTDFKKWGLTDTPVEEGSEYSAYPANINLLLVDIKKVKELVARDPFPGLMINMKSEAPYIAPDGTKSQIIAGRLESMMQNLSDKISSNDTYIAFNKRSKSISVTKNAYKLGGKEMETPVGCFNDMQHNYRELLKRCGFQTSEVLFNYHPALGPFYAIIQQKLRGGTIEKGSELQLEIADVSIEKLQLDGSLIIEAENVLGSKDENGVIAYNDLTGKCELKNVTVKNRGIDENGDNEYWSNTIKRHESLKIVIEGNGEFVANNVEFSGNYDIRVPNGVTMTAIQKGSRVCFEEKKLSKPSWKWDYTIDEDERVELKRSEL